MITISIKLLMEVFGAFINSWRACPCLPHTGRLRVYKIASYLNRVKLLTLVILKIKPDLKPWYLSINELFELS